jgi:hypothetical protein
LKNRLFSTPVMTYLGWDGILLPRYMFMSTSVDELFDIARVLEAMRMKKVEARRLVSFMIIQCLNIDLEGVEDV